jgi:peptidoglycan-N-acetylmuramic acid deacetylase
MNGTKKVVTIISAILIVIFSTSSCSFKKQFVKKAADNTIDKNSVSKNEPATQPNPVNSNNAPDEKENDDNKYSDRIVDKTNADGLSNEKHEWGFRPNSEHKTPEIPENIMNLLNKYSGYYVGDTSSKVIYLTFDEGYENGYTLKILDVLKANNVKAAFFVTRPYILQNKEIVKRMMDEGHIVGNHTSKHPSMPSVTASLERFNKEFSDTEDAYREVTGKDMPKFFRPPMGEFSEKSLYLTQKLGYKSIFWSFAHKDWLVDQQPSVESTIERVLKRSHNGEIMLLHAVSKSNTEALDSIIKQLQSQGYHFESLEQLK